MESPDYEMCALLCLMEFLIEINLCVFKGNILSVYSKLRYRLWGTETLTPELSGWEA